MRTSRTSVVDLADPKVTHHRPLPRSGPELLRVLLTYARQGADVESLAVAFETLVILPGRRGR